MRSLVYVSELGFKVSNIWKLLLNSLHDEVQQVHFLVAGLCVEQLQTKRHKNQELHREWTRPLIESYNSTQSALDHSPSLIILYKGS